MFEVQEGVAVAIAEPGSDELPLDVTLTVTEAGLLVLADPAEDQEASSAEPAPFGPWADARRKDDEEDEEEEDEEGDDDEEEDDADDDLEEDFDEEEFDEEDDDEFEEEEFDDDDDDA